MIRLRQVALVARDLAVVDDLDARLEHLQDHNVRVVWSTDLPTIRGRHLHPRDVGGALVSIDEPVPAGSWTWGGADWVAHPDAAVTSIAGVTVAATDPAAMRARWTELDLDVSVRFADAGEKGEGIDVMDLVARDRARVGERVSVCGITVTLV